MTKPPVDLIAVRRLASEAAVFPWPAMTQGRFAAEARPMLAACTDEIEQLRADLAARREAGDRIDFHEPPRSVVDAFAETSDAEKP